MTKEEFEVKKATLESEITQLIGIFEEETTSFVISLDYTKKTLSSSMDTKAGKLTMEYRNNITIDAKFIA